MISRRLPLLVVLLLLIGGVFLVSKKPPEALTAQFAEVRTPATPYALSRSQTSESWFCPGVPAAGDGYSGTIVVANPTAQPLSARYTLFNPDGPPATQSLDVPAFQRVSVEVTDAINAEFVSALVEIDEGRAVVEQHAVTPSGEAIAPCGNDASDQWYFADGFTVGESTEQLVLTNPFPGRAIVDIGFVTRAGARSPTVFQGYVIPSEGMKVINLADAGVKDEPILAIQIRATTGRFVAGRAQHYVDGGRLGYTMTLGAPSLDDQWWFADGETGEDIAETFVVFNPTDEPVDADVVFLGLQLGKDEAPPEAVTLQVPANDVVTFSSSASDLPDGPHGAVISTLSTDSIVVERVLTRPTDEAVATSVQLGSQSAFVGSRWHVPSGTDEALDQALVVLNVSYNAGTVTVNAIGPGGEQPVPGLEEMEIPANGILRIDLTDPAVLGRHLVVQSTVPVVVERRPSRGVDQSGRGSALAIPEY